MPKPNWIPLAVVTQPHGVSGRIKLKSFTEPARAFAAYDALTDAQGNPVKLRVTGEAQGLVIVEVEGLTKREAAELWRGKQIGIERDQLPATEHSDEFYIADLIGMEVVTTTGTTFGTVHDVANFGAGDLLDIEHTDGTREFYAFTQATFPSQDLAGGQLTIDPPQMLGSKAEEEGAA